MATTAPSTGERSSGAAAADGVQLRHLPLSRIIVPDGFNPRGEVVDDRELEQMAESIRQDGCLQPIRVRATEHGDYVLIAGERRYRAAVKAAVMELPAIIRPVGLGDEDEHADLLVEALIENDLRQDLDPLARARGYQRLIDSGRTIKGIAERLQTTQVRVREHLRVLKLPEALQRRVAAAEIPLRAVKALAQLESIHSGLASAAAGEVIQPADAYERYTWADVERAPLEVALAGGELPEGVYRARTAYPIDALSLGDGARKDLAALERMLGRTIGEIRFDATDLEQARALGAAHGDGWQALIVGADVAAQLAADQLARAVKTQRQPVRAERERAVSQSGVAVDSSDDGTAGVSPPVEQDPDEAKRAEREAEREARERATQFNLELGRAVYTTLSRLRVDEAVLKILASVEIVGELADIAMRGARYGLPGWVSETPQKNGRTKYGYLERTEAEQRARAYLGRAEKAGEIAGRQVALLAMATYADQSAVAASNRSWHHIKASGPWAGELDELLDALVREKLPENALALLEPVLANRGEEQAARAADREAREQAKARLEGIEDRIAEMSVDQDRPGRTGPRERLDRMDAAAQRHASDAHRPAPGADSRERQRVAAMLPAARQRAAGALALAAASETDPSYVRTPDGARGVGDRLSHPARPSNHEERQMPAGLAITDSMFSVREVPWHGLGAVLDHTPSTIAEAIEASGLRWRVEREPIAIDRGDVATVDDWRLPRCEEITGWWANVRQDTREVLGIVGERYRIVQNMEAFQFVDQLIGSAMHFETAGSLHGGRRVWVLARLPEHIEVGGDPVRPCVLLMNSQRTASHCLL